MIKNTYLKRNTKPGLLKNIQGNFSHKGRE